MSSEKKLEGLPIYMLPQHELYSRSQDDEIDLVDVWRTLVKRKKIIAYSVIASLALGIVFALTKPEKFSFSTVVIIGMQTIEKNGEVIGRTPIEPIDDALNKVKSAYIPLILAQHRLKDKGKLGKREINANSPKGSNVIILDMVCKPNDEKVCKSLIEGVSQKLIDDDTVIAEVSRKGLQVKIAAAENALLANQLKEKKSLLDRSLKNRASIKSSNAANAMSVLLIDNELQKNQTLVDDLEKRLLIDLNQERDDLEKAQKDNIRLQKEQEFTVDQLKNLMLGVSNTKAIVPVLRSDEPVGIKTSVIALLAIMLGFFVGLLAVLFAGLMDKAKKQDNDAVA
jgi:energy-converting hydrogenase Eha subunit A